MKKRIARNRSETGMTLMEMVVVMAVLAVLAAMLSPTLLSMIEDARRGRAESDVKTIASAILVFNKDLNRWPIWPVFPGPGVTVTPVDALKSLDGDEPVVSGGTGWTDPLAALNNSLDGQLMTNAPVYPTTGRRKWQGPYLERISADPWGSKYVVNVDKLAPASDFGTKAAYILSAGQNRTIDTTFSQDVTNFTVGGDDIVYRIK